MKVLEFSRETEAMEKRLHRGPDPDTASHNRFINLLSNKWKSIYLDYFAGKFSIRELIDRRNEPNIGLGAMINRSGFRADGSHKYVMAEQSIRRAALRTNIEAKISAMKNDRGSFLYGKQISDETLADLLWEYSPEVQRRLRIAAEELRVGKVEPMKSFAKRHGLA